VLPVPVVPLEPAASLEPLEPLVPLDPLAPVAPLEPVAPPEPLEPVAPLEPLLPVAAAPDEALPPSLLLALSPDLLQAASETAISAPMRRLWMGFMMCS